jgi:hypothetical protein
LRGQIRGSPVRIRSHPQKFEVRVGPMGWLFCYPAQNPENGRAIHRRAWLEAQMTGMTNSSSLKRLGTFAQPRILTAREITTATVINEARDCSIINSFAQGVSGIVSVGLKAVALVNEV